jgi:hypothetical protein
MGSDFERELFWPLKEDHAAHRSRFCVGAVSVGVAGRRIDDVALVPSLYPFRVEMGNSDLDINVEWVSTLGLTVGRRIFDSGTTWRLYENEAGFQFDIRAPIFGEGPYKKLQVDRRFRQATLQMSEESFATFPCPAQPLEYPLDELLIMHRLTQEKAIELHGCGIVRPDGTGNLFVGHSGAGKSTTTRLWTAREDVQVLSDDRIIVRRDSGWQDAPRPRAAEAASDCAGSAARLKSCPSQTLPLESIPLQPVSGVRMYGTPWHGEAAYASPGSAPLARIFILEHGQGNVLRRLSPSQAVAELFARSFVPFHQHEYVDSALEFLQELVGSVPCYHYAFEPDERAVDTVLNFHD